MRALTSASEVLVVKLAAGLAAAAGLAPVPPPSPSLSCGVASGGVPRVGVAVRGEVRGDESRCASVPSPPLTSPMPLSPSFSPARGLTCWGGLLLVAAPSTFFRVTWRACLPFSISAATRAAKPPASPLAKFSAMEDSSCLSSACTEA